MRCSAGEVEKHQRCSAREMGRLFQSTSRQFCPRRFRVQPPVTPIRLSSIIPGQSRPCPLWAFLGPGQSYLRIISPPSGRSCSRALQALNEARMDRRKNPFCPTRTMVFTSPRYHCIPPYSILNRDFCNVFISFRPVNMSDPDMMGWCRSRTNR